jgi:hypothetical protein
MIMKTFWAVAIFLEESAAEPHGRLIVAGKQLQDRSVVTSNNLANGRGHMLPVAKSLRENPPPFRCRCLSSDRSL